MGKREKLEQAVEDTRAYMWDWGLSAIEAGNYFDSNASEAAIFAVDQAEEALADYCNDTTTMTDEEKEQFYWDNPEAIPDREQD